MNNTGPVMLSQTVAGCSAEIGTAMAYGVKEMLTTDIDEVRSVNLIVLCGDYHADQKKSERYYPQPEWDSYCLWVKENMPLRRTRYLIWSPFWVPSEAQRAKMKDTLQMKDEDKKTYYTAVVKSPQKASRFVRSIYSVAALGVRIVDKIPIMFYPDGDLQSAFEYIRIRPEHIEDAKMMFNGLQRAIDRRHGRSLQPSVW